MRGRLALIDAVDTRGRRPAATGTRDCVDRRGRSRENRLDLAVAAVADPAGESLIKRGVLHERAVANALNAAAYDEMAGDTHPTSPVSFARAPAQRDGAQRAIAWI